MSSSEKSKARVLERIGKEKKQLTKLCSDLIKIQTENPPGDTTELAGYLKDRLANFGFRVRTFEPRRKMPNLVASYGHTQVKNLVLCAHMDVFPAGPGWSFPPFSGRRTKGHILGRGSVDMKAGLAASVYAFELLAQLEQVLNGGLTIALVSDEETMGRWGAEWLLKRVPEVRGDACLIGEPGGTDVITIGEKGIWWFKLTVTGTTAHAAYGAGENAIAKLCNAIAGLEELKRLRGRTPYELKRIVAAQKKIIESKYWRGTSKALDHLTLNLGLVEGGLKINLVPPRCEASFDARLPIGLTTDELERRVKTKLNSASIKGTSIDTIFSINAAYTSPSHSFVEVTKKNVRLITERDPKLFFRLGSTDAKFFRRFGIPSVTYGPSPRRMGERDEYVKVNELITTTKVHAGIALDYLSNSE